MGKKKEKKRKDHYAVSYMIDFCDAAKHTDHQLIPLDKMHLLFKISLILVIENFQTV